MNRNKEIEIAILEFLAKHYEVCAVMRQISVLNSETKKAEGDVRVRASVYHLEDMGYVRIIRDSAQAVTHGFNGYLCRITAQGCDYLEEVRAKHG